MTTGLVLALAAAAMVVLGGLWWRRVSARRALPCPPWLVPLLENPHVEALAGARTLLDRAFLVTVLGEIVDKRRALQGIHDLLEPGGLLSVTEVFPDPHYQSRRSVRELAGAVGLREQEAFGSRLAVSRPGF